ncbi:MAG: LamG-like jellyroll fold domain-containing protein, partial [Phycisphaerales bacterium]
MPVRNAFFCITLCIAGLTALATAAQPLVYYSFDTLDTTVVDESGNGNNGTVNGGVTLDAGGHLGSCFAFNGSNAYIQLTRVIQDDFTITAWIKTSTTGAAGTQAYQGSGLFWSDVGGTANDLVVAVLGTKLSFFAGNPDTSVNSNGDIVTGEWVYITAVRNTTAKTLSVYIDGTLDNSVSHSNTGALNANPNFVIGSNTLDSRYYTGLMDEVRLFDVVLTDAEIVTIMKGAPLAQDPAPEDGAVDVPRDVVLAWTAAETIATHDIYLGTAFADVNDAGRDDPRGTLVSQDQTDAAFDPDGLLEFGQTYYWRIDEVNGAPDYTVFQGDVWSFTTETYAYPITSLTVTASAQQSTSPAIRTIDGSGLDDLDQHGVDLKNMWVTPAGLPAWIQYEFDREYKLHELWVWNSNSELEVLMGFGAKDVAIEYSADGATWTALENVPQFAQGTGVVTYTANTVVDFGGVVAKYVKLTINDNWGASAMVSLSEVRFFYVPVQAFEPDPADGATAVSVAAELNWRPGREAASHEVYFGTDANAVAESAVAAETVTDHSYAPALDFSTTYYWKVDEVGDAGTYPGVVWSFTTEDYTSVDDFDSYTDDQDAGTAIFQAWLDGYEDDNNGSLVGYFDPPFAEQTVIHGGKQSMPLAYDNTGGVAYSEATRSFDPAQDWTQHGVTTLVLYFRGQITNDPAPLYVKINNTKVSYNNGADATTMP